jgi:hypothetical protein
MPALIILSGTGIRGGKISDVSDRGTVGCRGKWQAFFRPKRMDMPWFWKVFGSVISFGSGQRTVLRLALRFLGAAEKFSRFQQKPRFIRNQPPTR